MENDNKLSLLDKNSLNDEIQFAPYFEGKKIIESIWDILTKDEYNGDEDPEEIISLFKDVSEKEIRLPYSAITEKVFQNSDKSDSIESRFLTLFSKLEEKTDTELFKVLQRFYDHVHLAYIQHRNMHSTDSQLEDLQQKISTQVEDAIKKLDEEKKDIQRETITILGIFSAIVVSVTGVLSFSSKLIESLEKTPMSKICAMTMVLFAAFCLVLSVLTDFILKLHEKKLQDIWWWKCFAMIGVCLSAMLIAEYWKC